VKVQFV